MIGSFVKRCKLSSRVAGHRPRRHLRFEELESRLAPSVNVLTYRNDNVSPGVNSNETQLTPSNVNVGSFGKLFATPVDGQIYAEPLIDTGVTITNGVNTRAGAAGIHDVVFVATEHDSLYAIDASAGGGAILWQRSFLDAGNPSGDINNTLGAAAITTVPYTDVNSDLLSPEIGITGTPVIDPSTNLLYVVVMTKETIAGSAHYVQRLHAINLSDGTDAASPALIGDTTNGNANNTQVYVYGSGDGFVTDPYNGTGKPVVQFNALRENQRGALSLVNNEVYVDWASFGDVGPYHGWIVVWDVSNVKTSGLQMKGVFNSSPNDGLAGIWESGGALAFEADGSAFYFETGNGSGGPPTLNANGFPTNANYNEALVKMTADPTTSPTNQNPNGWGLKVIDYFIPYNVAALDGADSDFGSGAPLILPDSAGIPNHPHLLLASGKEGEIYVVDRDNLGHFNPSGDNVLNAVPNGNGNNAPPVQIAGALSTAAFFNGKIYWVSGYNSSANAYVLNSNGSLSITSQTNITFGNLPGSVVISADGTTDGIAWVMDLNLNAIHAYDATTFATELWNSGQRAGGADNLGSVVKFAVPTVANGEVYVGTSNSLVVYGLTRQPNAVPNPPVLKATALSGSSINLTWTDSTAPPNTATGYDIEQSTDNVSFTQVATAPAGATSIAIGNLSPQTTYYFRIRGFNSLGDSNDSNTASATTAGQVAGLDFSGGFAGSTSQLTYNGSAVINGTKAELTNGGQSQAGSLFSTAAVDITRFTTQFTFQLSAGSSTADGFTFCIQGDGPTALGAAGGDLGYRPILNSVAIKFDLFNDQGEGVDSTGLYTDGVFPGVAGSISLSGTGIDLHSGDAFQVNISYDGTTLSVTITDTVTGKSAAQNYAINIPATVGNNGAYMGFTGSTSSLTATQDILTWTYSPSALASPNAPSGLGATPASANSVFLTWTNNATNQTGFHLDRATDPGFTMNLITENLPANATSFTDSATGLAPGGTYYYRIRAYNSAGDSGNSNVASVTIPLAPPAPTNQQVTNVTTSEIDLSWQDNAGRLANGYKILRSVNGGSFSQVASLPPTSRTAPSSYTWADTNLTPGTFYEYHIIAYNISGNNGFADISATTITLPPSGVSATAGNAVVMLSWTAPAGAKTYNIYRATVSGKEVILAAGVAATSYTDSAVTNGTTYFYTVTAVNGNAAIVPVIPSESGPSSEVQATPTAVNPANTTIVLAATPNPSQLGFHVVFTATITVNAPGSTALATPTGTVTFFDGFTKIGQATISTNSSGATTATFAYPGLSAGTHTITASYSGDANFAGSASAPWTQTVNSPSAVATITRLGSSVNPSVIGQNVVFTATISAGGGSGTPSGTVQFAIDGRNFGSPVSISGSGGVSTASFSTASLNVGTHTITASYSGDVSFAGSSGSLTQTVNGPSAVATITTLGSSANPSLFGYNVVFTATITAGGGSGTPSGTVQFAIDGRIFGSPVSLSGSGGVSTTSFSTASLTVGMHTVTANYSGNANFAASSGSYTQTVQGAPAITADVTATLDPATGILNITGDSNNDAITVTQNSPGVLRISGVNTLINQSSTPATYALSSISAIDVSMPNGNDSVSMSNFTISGELSIIAGSGTDTITLDTIAASFLSLSAAGPAADVLTLNNLTVGSAGVTAGANATLTLNGLNSLGTILLTAGSNATVGVNNLTTSADLDITVGDNTQAVTVKGSSANDLNIRQTGTTGSPLFDLEYDTVNNLNLQAGSGNNRLVFSHVKVTIDLLAFLGSGDNTLSADHVTALFGFINGGTSGNNFYTDGGGNQGLIVVNFIRR
jgi:hypothetical protein